MNTLIFRENTTVLDEKQSLAHILQFTGRNVNSDQLASALLDTFGSLKNVLEARPEQLRTVSGIGEKTADFIASLIGIVKLWQRCTMQEQTLLSSSHDAAAYGKSLLSGARNEEFWVVCLNAQCKILGERKISSGSLSEVSAYPRLIMETALNYNAHSILMYHNHPGGTCAPSSEDIMSTIKIKKLMKEVGVEILDHIIVAGDLTYSMLQHGDITYS